MHICRFKNSAPREFPKCEAILFTRPVMTLCELAIVIFIFFQWLLINDCSQFEFYFPSQMIFSTHFPIFHPQTCTKNHPKTHQEKCSNNKCLRKKLIEKSSKLTFAGLSTLHAPPIAIFYNPRRRCVYPCCLGDPIIVLFRESTKHLPVFRPAPVFEEFQHYFLAFWVVIEMKNLIFWLCAPSSIQVWFESVYKFVLEVF